MCSAFVACLTACKVARKRSAMDDNAMTFARGRPQKIKQFSKTELNRIDDVAGLYRFRCSSCRANLYIGLASNLRNRIITHIRNNRITPCKCGESRYYLEYKSYALTDANLVQRDFGDLKRLSPDQQEELAEHIDAELRKAEKRWQLRHNPVQNERGAGGGRKAKQPAKGYSITTVSDAKRGSLFSRLFGR